MLVLLFVGLVLSLEFVSAGPVEDVNQVFKVIVDILRPLFELFLGPYSDQQIFFASVLLFVIIFSMVWVALNRMPLFSDNAWVLWIVSIAVAMLGTRWLGTKAIIETILLPYSTIGIVLTAGLPFLIFFAFVEFGLEGPQYRMVRKIAWVFFSVVFIFLWFARYEVISEATTQAGGGWLRHVYWIVVLISLGLAWGDGTIQKYIFEHKLSRGRTAVRNRHADALRRELAQVDSDLASGIITPADYQQRLRDIHRRMRALGAAGP